MTDRLEERIAAGSPKSCAEGERDRVAFRRWKPLSLVVSQVGKHPRSAGGLGMVWQPWHQVEVQVGEPLCLGELHKVRLYAAGDGLWSAAQAAYEPTEFVGGLRRQIRERRDVPRRQEDEPAGQRAVERMGDAPVIGVYDVLARWKSGRRLLAAGEASGHEVVGVHVGTLYLEGRDNVSPRDASYVPLAEPCPNPRRAGQPLQVGTVTLTQHRGRCRRTVPE